jgi:hypothetical protein
MTDKTKVRVLGKYRLLYAGNPYVGGDVVEVDARIAADWIRQHWAEAVEDNKPTKSAPRKAKPSR